MSGLRIQSALSGVAAIVIAAAGALLSASPAEGAGMLVHGRVSGQDAKGEHTGPVAGAKIEFLSGESVAASVTTGANGYYRAEGLAAGDYTYKIAAEGYAPEDAGRGFTVPAAGEDFVLDFILAPGGAKDEKPAELSGHVWRERASGKTPVAGARVAVRRSSGGGLVVATSDGEGAYRFELTADEWRASASSEGFGAKVHGKAIVLEAGGREVVDFVFAEGDRDKPVTGAVPPVDPVTMPDPGVHGRVTGQNDDGEHLGPLAGTKVEFLDGSGSVAGSAETNEHGYYRFDRLKPGNYTYRLTAAGFRKEDEGRGFELRADAKMEVLDFILSKGGEKEKPGKISGHVWLQDGEKKVPIGEATVYLRQESGGGLSTLRTDASGAYSMEVPASKWRASAMAEGFGLKVHPSAVAVAAGGEARIDFVFGEDAPVVKKTGEVFALISVQVADSTNAGGALPEAFFVKKGSEAKHAAAVRPMTDSELADSGIPTGGVSGKLWEWFMARPAQPLAAGPYLAGARLPKYQPGSSKVKEVSADFSTWFDVVLSPEGEQKTPVFGANVPGSSRVHGRVTGQDDKGDHEGPIAGSRIEFMDAGGRRVAAAQTNGFGYYAIANLAPGEYTYRVSGAPYATDDSGKGFTMPQDAESYVLDFILCRETKRPEGPGELIGHVWLESEGAKTPLANAMVAVAVEGEGVKASVHTDEEGMYEFLLPPGGWRVGAMAEPYGNQAHPETVAIKSGSEERVDFTFKESEMEWPEAYILAAVERTAAEQGDPPHLALLIGAEGRQSGEIEDLEIEALGADPRNSEFFQEFGLELGGEMEGEWQWYLAYPREEVNLVPGLYHAAGALEGYLDDMSGTKTVSPEWPAIFDLVFERVRPDVEVFVQTKDREPLPNVEVRFINTTLGRTLEQAIPCTTDDKGMGMTELGDGLGEYNVVLTCAGYESQMRTLVADQELLKVHAQMFRKGEIPTVDLAGTVVEAREGGPAAGGGATAIGNAMVELTPATGQALPAGLPQPLVTDGNGGFLAERMPLGEFTVAIAAEGYKDRKATLTIELGMAPAILELDPLNKELENHIRMILTEGWGPGGTAVAQRSYQAALKEDPNDCRVDYAMALSIFSTGNAPAALVPLGSAVGKKDGTLFWDRVCEARVWLQMFQKAGPAAVQEIRALCEHHYGDRAPNEASTETAFVLGVAVGVLKGPWNDQANAKNHVELDAACMAALQDPHRSEYVRGRESVGSHFGKLAEAEVAAKEKLRAAAEAEKQRMIELGGKRMREIEAQLNQIAGQVNSINSTATAEISRLDVQIRGFTAQRQQLAAQYAPYQARIQQINSCLNQDQAEYEQYMASQNPEMRSEANAIMQEIREHQRDLILINNQAGTLMAQDQRYQAGIAQAQAQYNRLVAQQKQKLAGLQAQESVLVQEHQALSRGMGAPIQQGALNSTETANLERAKKEFITYRTFPLEERRQELLRSVTY